MLKRWCTFNQFISFLQSNGCITINWPNSFRSLPDCILPNSLLETPIPAHHHTNYSNSRLAKSYDTMMPSLTLLLLKIKLPSTPSWMRHWNTQSSPAFIALLFTIYKSSGQVLFHLAVSALFKLEIAYHMSPLKPSLIGIATFCGQ